MTAAKQQSNPELVEYRLKRVEDGNTAILKRMDSFNYAPSPVVDKLRVDFDTFKEDVEKNYVKKDDGKVVRGIVVAVITAICITLATMIITQAIKGAQ